VKSTQGDYDFRQGLFSRGKFLLLYPADVKIDILRHQFVSHPDYAVKSRGNLISIKKNMGESQQDFISVIIPSSKNTRVVLIEEKQNYQLQLENDTQSYLVLLRKQKGGKLKFLSYVIDAQLAIVTQNRSEEVKKILLFKGKSVFKNDEQIWKGNFEQNKSFDFDNENVGLDF